MIVIRVELWSAITGQKTELGRMHLWNDGSEPSQKLGNYEGRVLRAPKFDPTGTPVRAGKVKGYRKLDRPVWDLVTEMLIAMGYGKRSRKGKADEVSQHTAG